METTLYHTHIELGGKIVEFAGWQMPIQYRGILQEHKAVREGIGIFDVSHMGRIVVEGDDAEKFLDSLSTNKIAGKPDYSATYTVLPNEQGTCVDDVIIYKQNKSHYFLIVNAGNRAKDLAHLKHYANKFSVTIKDRFDLEGILSLQGPKALEIASTLFPEALQLKKMQFANVIYHNTPLIVATTGYTGESGIEIYAPTAIIKSLWDHFTQLGAVPIGLGARDTLRLEMGFALYGHELSDEIYPHESVSSWTIKWDDRDFVGKDAMLKRKATSETCQRGVMLEEKGIPREGYSVFVEGQPNGKVTSGTFSPSLEKGIAIVQFEKSVEIGQPVEIQIRQQLARGRVVPLPFYHKRTS